MVRFGRNAGGARQNDAARDFAVSDANLKLKQCGK